MAEFPHVWLFCSRGAAGFGEARGEQVVVFIYFTRIKLSPVPSVLFWGGFGGFFPSALFLFPLNQLEKECGLETKDVEDLI